MRRSGSGGLGARARAALVVAAVTAAGAASAEPRERDRGHAEARVGFVRFDYEEYDPRTGGFLDGETGLVPALALEGELRGAVAFGAVFGRALVRLSGGTVDYDGQVQSADPALDRLPARTESDASFRQAELQGGLSLGEAGRRVALFVGLGGRSWHRDIQPTTVISRTGVPARISGLIEDYSWAELQLGGRLTLAARPGTTWELDARLVRTFGAEMAVDLSPFVGVPQLLTLPLGSRTGWRLGGAFRHALGPSVLLALSAFAEAYGFGQSPVDPATGLLEPESDTFLLGVDVGLGVRF